MNWKQDLTEFSHDEACQFIVDYLLADSISLVIFKYIVDEMLIHMTLQNLEFF